MTTSQKTPFLAEALNASPTHPIPQKQLIYFRARLKTRIHTMLQNRLRDWLSRKQASQKDFAGRLGKRPEQITRWINSPSNLTLNTISDLLLAMGYEPLIGMADLGESAVAPHEEAWLRRDARRFDHQLSPVEPVAPKASEVLTDENPGAQDQSNVVGMLDYLNAAVRAQRERQERLPEQSEPSLPTSRFGQRLA